LQRVAKGGDVLAPGNPQQPLQLLDARDLASWILRMIEGKQTGVYNAVGPSRPLTFEQFLHACKETLQSDCRFVWVSEEKLLKDVQPWTELPLWIPDFLGGLMEIKGYEAYGQGLTCRPLEMTLADTWEWMKETSPSWPSQNWLSPEKELRFLK
jgi:2'-hydroxyisoflavone reductase